MFGRRGACALLLGLMTVLAATAPYSVTLAASGAWFAPRPIGAAEQTAVLLFDAGGVDLKRRRLGAGTFLVIVDTASGGAILSGPIPLELLREAGYEARVEFIRESAAVHRIGLRIADRADREVFRSETAPVAAGLTQLRTGSGAALGSGSSIDGLAMLIRSIELALAGNLPETDAFRARFASAVRAMPNSAYRREVVDGLIRRKYDLTPQQDPTADLHTDMPTVH